MVNIMDSSEIINMIWHEIKMLPSKKLEIALVFLEDLKISDEAETETLLNGPGLLEDYRQAEDDIQSDKKKGYR